MLMSHILSDLVDEVKQLAPAGQIQYGAGSLANQKPMRKSNWLERIMRRHLKRLCCLC